MREPTHLGTFRGVNNIIGRANTWSAYYGPLMMGMVFALGCGIAWVLAGMAPVTV